MRDALLCDLAQLPGLRLTASHDARLPPPQHVQHAVRVAGDDELMTVWQRCIAESDAVWLIAPETGGQLAALTALVMQAGKLLLGSSLTAVQLAGSKIATQHALAAADIAALPCYRYQDWPRNSAADWVVKPDDGAGCEDSRFFQDLHAVDGWIAGRREATHVIQPYQAGTAASISMLCHQGMAWLLSCNRQNVELVNGRFHYAGSTLNALTEHWRPLEKLAQRIAACIPGLSGYVGVDMIIHGRDIWVLEINPRLTTSYAGLQQAMGCNPAELVLDLLYNHGLQPENFVMPHSFARNVVEVSLIA